MQQCDDNRSASGGSSGQLPLGFRELHMYIDATHGAPPVHCRGHRMGRPQCPAAGTGQASQSSLDTLKNLGLRSTPLLPCTLCIAPPEGPFLSGRGPLEQTRPTITTGTPDGGGGPCQRVAVPAHSACSEQSERRCVLSLDAQIRLNWVLAEAGKGPTSAANFALSWTASACGPPPCAAGFPLTPPYFSGFLRQRLSI